MIWPFGKSVRARLTLWYVAVLAGILVVYVAVVIFFQFALLERQTFHDEIQDVETVEGLLFFDATGQLQLQQSYFARAKNRLLVDRLMQVQDASGSVLYRTATLKGMDLGGPTFTQEGVDSFDERTAKLSDGSRVTLISHVHPLNGRPLLIRLGYRLGPLEGRMTQFITLLLLGLPVALFCAGFAGYGIARRALYPLEAMADRAERITARDLSERLVIENAGDELGHMARVLNNLLARLEGAFTQLQRFTADAAHELRTPLASLRSAGELALDRATDAGELRETVSSMLEETVRLNQTIDGLLILARTEARQLGETTERIDMPELVLEVLTLLEVVMEDRRISVSQSKANELSGICADRSLVRLALVNVVHNALKFSPPGSRLVISYVNTVIEAQQVERVSIADAGPGIQEGEHERVFERFFTSKSPDTLSESGSGLGLSIAALAITRVGGRIFFDKGVTEGARCCIDLPACSSRE